MSESSTLPVRSWLFAPGDSARKVEKAIASAADIAILDLEDAVEESRKAEARAAVRDVLAATPVAERGRLWVRINPLQGEHALADLSAIVQGLPGGVLLPKPRGRADAERLDHYLTALEASVGAVLGSTRVMILATEEPQSLLSIGGYAGVPRVAAMTWGAEDLATALGAQDNAGPYGGYDFTYELARSLCLVAAAAAGVPAIDTIHANFRDEAGLRVRAQAVRRAGFRGMLAIHPAQVDAINEIFSPSDEECAAAQAIVDLFAAHPGAGTLAHNGSMLDRPHLERARSLLALARRPP